MDEKGKSRKNDWENEGGSDAENRLDTDNTESAED
jgi:hypothetical protein